MEAKNPSHILDASVAIDLVNGGLLDVVAMLPFTIGIPDIILHFELHTYTEYHSDQCSFIEIEFEEAQIIEVTRLKTYTNKVSTPDLFAFISAKYYSCCLITGDKNLRKLAKAKDVTVHGALWLLDVLISRSLLSKTEASEALHKMLSKGSRFPKDECVRRFRRWNAPRKYYEAL